jgi:signal transduction histidine kinase
MMNTVILSIVFLIAFGVCVLLMRRHYMRLVDRAMKRAQKSGHLKSVFIDNISSTLRKPLNAISDFSDKLLDEKDEKVRELATSISTHAKELVDYVEQLHEMSKFEGITPSFTFIEVNLTELMASYRREALNYTKPEVAIRVSTDLSPHCRAILDTNLMHQLMMHLLANAAYHVTQGNIFINYNCERRGLKVAIKYAGMNQVDLVGADINLFLEKKEALKNSGTSTLFGIAISKAIVDMLGGEFFMETENEKKTVVSFWFPCEMKDTYKDM